MPFIYGRIGLFWHLMANTIPLQHLQRRVYQDAQVQRQ